MAVNRNARLQRTQRGEEELRQKSHVLTQTERLVLALADGATPIEQLQQKVSGVVERRFKLVVADLSAKGFLEDIPLLAQETKGQSEKVDAATLARFVLQDPLDPVTITALHITRTNKVKAAQDAPVHTENLAHPVTPPALPPEEVDFYLPLEPVSMSSNVSALNPVPNLVMTNSTEQDDESSSKRRMRRAERSKNIQLGYGLLFVGLICAIIGIVLLQSH